MLFVATIKFTEQGITNIQDTCKRADEFTKSAEKMGVKVADIFWTLGPSDGLLIFDAPDEDTATALMLKLGAQGNVHTQTSRAYRAADMKGILEKMAQ